MVTERLKFSDCLVCRQLYLCLFFLSYLAKTLDHRFIGRIGIVSVGLCYRLCSTCGNRFWLISGGDFKTLPSA